MVTSCTRDVCLQRNEIVANYRRWFRFYKTTNYRLIVTVHFLVDSFFRLINVTLLIMHTRTYPMPFYKESQISSRTRRGNAVYDTEETSVEKFVPFVCFVKRWGTDVVERKASRAISVDECMFCERVEFGALSRSHKQFDGKLCLLARRNCGNTSELVLCFVLC